MKVSPAFFEAGRRRLDLHAGPRYSSKNNQSLPSPPPLVLCDPNSSFTCSGQSNCRNLTWWLLISHDFYELSHLCCCSHALSCSYAAPVVDPIEPPGILHLPNSLQISSSSFQTVTCRTIQLIWGVRTCR